ncbi:hypothetical protein Nepgr_025378 [Nepenthes gracilis]|uniref:Uncharacterized protein n=1 Tax=Nepenthes gracilis TaxID=150966 RepID=A0AAD3Y102_NEPGR|nr:hypothetical protein Nepgr_025378 [Nepenthes gracilis]
MLHQNRKKPQTSPAEERPTHQPIGCPEHPKAAMSNIIDHQQPSNIKLSLLFQLSKAKPARNPKFCHEPPPSSNTSAGQERRKHPKNFNSWNHQAAPNAPAYICHSQPNSTSFLGPYLEDGTKIQQQITLPSIATFGPASLNQQPGIMESRHSIDHSDHQHQQVGFRVQPSEATSSRQQLTSRADKHHHTPTAS